MKQRCLGVVFAAASEPLALQEFELPKLVSGELLVRVTCCTICGSDLHTYQGHRSTPTPTILGHEILGVIAALGPGDAPADLQGHTLRVGNRITWSIAANCGACFFCEHELPQKCEHVFKYGHERISPKHPLSGGLAEFCHLAAKTPVVRLPETLPDLAACPANCATATVAAALRTVGGCRGQVVLVQGVGMLGLTACSMARTQGAREVIAWDLDARRLELSARFGATVCINAGLGTNALAEAVRAATANRGVDVALELSGAPESMETGLPLLRIGGHYALVGATFPTRPVAVNPEIIVRRWLNLHGVHNYTPRDLMTAVQFLSEHHAQFPFASLVSQSFPLSSAEAAFQEAIRNRPLRIAIQSS